MFAWLSILAFVAARQHTPKTCQPGVVKKKCACGTRRDTCYKKDFCEKNGCVPHGSLGSADQPVKHFYEEVDFGAVRRCKVIRKSFGNASNRDDCARLCQAAWYSSGCRSFEYATDAALNPTSHECNQCETDEVKTAGRFEVHFTVSKVTERPEANFYRKVFDGEECSGGESLGSATDSEACGTACLKKKSCNYFTFDEESEECQSMATCENPRASSYGDSYESSFKTPAAISRNVSVNANSYYAEQDEPEYSEDVLKTCSGEKWYSAEKGNEANFTFTFDSPVTVDGIYIQSTYEYVKDINVSLGGSAYRPVSTKVGEYYEGVYSFGMQKAKKVHLKFQYLTYDYFELSCLKLREVQIESRRERQTSCLRDFFTKPTSCNKVKKEIPGRNNYQGNEAKHALLYGAYAACCLSRARTAAGSSATWIAIGASIAAVVVLVASFLGVRHWKKHKDSTEALNTRRQTNGQKQRHGAQKREPRE